MALYRKYRPATFAEVVGQEHVTEPLSTALDSGRINHAYLFSGPRGCGKTSSARILARSLNCVQGPTSTPCGECPSCQALAPGGPGTLDVTELDAATHNGVDDMRELRDRAFYAPAESRYRVFIIDEAHMISQAGFNALLKIVEEPPEHLIFIFATTEPEKLLQTIRSRTHNYPFRLLTPPAMRGLLGRVCEEEHADIEDSVYPLVIRAGGGSPRDSLSIMDQLLAGAGTGGVTYSRAVALLGFTDTALIDRAVDALVEQDQAGLFGCVSDVIDAGHDPRRFAMDLLDRFRDLLVVQAVPDAFDTGLVDVPADQRDALVAQAGNLGQATLTRCAALVNEGLAQMRGATAPRLLLEILCARMALPAAGMTVEALAQRVEALEAGGTAGVTAGSGSGGAPASGSGRVYVRKSQREARAARSDQDAAPQAQPAESPQPAETAGPAEPAVSPTAEPAVAETSPAADNTPAPAETPVAAGDTPAEPAHPEEPGEDSRRSEAERAREIMRRRRQPAAYPQQPEPPAEPEPEPEAEQEQQPQSEPEPEPEPDSENQSEPAAAQDPAAGQVGHPVEKWDEILGVVKENNLAAWIAARDATAAEGATGPDGEPTIDLTHHTGALANYINDPEHAAVYSRAAQQVTGANIQFRAHVGGGSRPSPAAPAAQGTTAQGPPGKAEAAADPQPEPAPEPAPDPEPVAPPAAVAQEAPAAPARPAPDSGSEQLTGWRARKAKFDARKQAQQGGPSHPASGDPGFDGVPLPEEPSEPWDDGPGDLGGPGNVPPDPDTSRTMDRAEAEEAMAQLDDPSSSNIDHRSALEIAGALIEDQLGAERTR
ncbi:MAG: DNA polymerase III subunit gamma and tau [Corynebacterium sp.]|uniref:DNA polymerase III subunit gamma and tau n=1 Tax=Corynebacterium sp. TaxID=1720 RepID=UPI003F98980A